MIIHDYQLNNSGISIFISQYPTYDSGWLYKNPIVDNHSWIILREVTMSSNYYWGYYLLLLWVTQLLNIQLQ